MGEARLLKIPRSFCHLISCLGVQYLTLGLRRCPTLRSAQLGFPVPLQTARQSLPLRSSGCPGVVTPSFAAENLSKKLVHLILNKLFTKCLFTRFSILNVIGQFPCVQVSFVLT